MRHFRLSSPFLFKHFPFLVLVLMLCSALSCDKEEPSLDASGNLPNKQWAFTELKLSSLLYSADLYADFEDCERDDYLEFRAGGVLMMDEGPTKCDPSDPQQKQGTWSVNNNILTITGLDVGIPISTVNITVTKSTDTILEGTFQEKYQGVTVNGELTLEVK